MTLRKIISGGQTGADQAGLYAAAALGYETGGWMPAGFLTETGPAPELARRFGLREHSSRHYPDRTRANVEASDGTLYCYRQPGSRGFLSTCEAVNAFKRPLLTLEFIPTWTPKASVLLAWLEERRIQTLNVAGNRESIAPGIRAAVFEWLVHALPRRMVALEVRS